MWGSEGGKEQQKSSKINALKLLWGGHQIGYKKEYIKKKGRRERKKMVVGDQGYKEGPDNAKVKGRVTALCS